MSMEEWYEYTMSMSIGLFVGFLPPRLVVPDEADRTNIAHASYTMTMMYLSLFTT